LAHSTNTLGRYQIIREIARSNDIVYEAIDPSIGRRVALKELQLPPNLVGGARRERVERFYREAKAAGSLTHPNIVTIYEVGEEAGRHFIAMEFLEGQNLQETLEIRGALPAKEAVDIARQVLEALDYAHSKGIIHRDIKPANIQLLPGGRVKLTDFGIARIMHEPSITASGQIFGTPSYMSPEQIAGKEIDPRSDLFSMGVVLYEALTGQKPFTGDSVVTITYNIMNTPAPEPRGVPEGLAAIIRKALEKDPAHRFQSAREFLDALSQDWTAPQNAAGTLTPPPVFFPPGGGTGPLPSPTPVPPGAPPQTTLPPAGSAPGPTGPAPGAPPLPPLPPLPPEPRGPLLTPAQKSALVTLMLALVLGALLLGAVMGINAAWHSYQQRQNDARAKSLISDGFEHLKSGNYAGAIPLLEQALQLDLTPATQATVKKGLAAAHRGMGVSLLNTGRLREAEQELMTSLNYDPDSGDTLFALGETHWRLGDPAAAARDWEEAVSRDRKSRGGQLSLDRLQRLYWDLGMRSYLQGDTGEAVRLWREVVRLDAQSPLGQRAQDAITTALMTQGR
jgi:serine/threonine-protein kinase